MAELQALQATVSSQRGDIERLRIEIESLRRELATYRPDPDRTPAPRHDGYVWTAKHSYCGPYHLVKITWEPYPVATEPPMPDIWQPAAKALCGEPWHGTAQLWPAASEACAECVRRAAAEVKPASEPTLFDAGVA